MSARHPQAAWARDYQPSDAAGISALFRAIYDDRYFYADVYLPSQIEQRNASGQWRSAVAIHDGRLLGHAALWLDPARPGQAELAMNVVHPDARGQGIASLLGRHLRAAAPGLGIELLTIKQVCAHPRSQYVARALGFHNTALLPDYIDTPFAGPEPESILFGCLPLKPRPLPRLDWPENWKEWLAPLRQALGEESGAVSSSNLPGLALARHGQRLELTARQPTQARLAEIAALPASQLIYLKLPANQEAMARETQLREAGFRFGGLLPAASGGWQLLWLRGASAREIRFCDEQAERLRRLG
ncbi:GNAT family N-acetyltransferase [Chromobacterium phragmitis]|uniref:GNAT family N-acetyltransferase n=1 Tax=Chromobacterium phragmitis TaxID=2202141 RepID=A0A344UJV3_9NEIS|nr:GNAT family N-acetyltransferase [Chromobacterium phragmitis]AXE35551.1 GNAT family N-acetyltransferase [Chromobacterium phragmitis]